MLLSSTGKKWISVFVPIRSVFANSVTYLFQPTAVHFYYMGRIGNNLRIYFEIEQQMIKTYRFQKPISKF